MFHRTSEFHRTAERFVVLVFASVLLFWSAKSADAGILYTGGTYIQNFDTLANSPEGSNNAWTNDATIPGWFSDESDYTVEEGTTTSGSLYSFGTSGDVDRALGSIASGGTGIVFYGAEFINNTGQTINDFTLSYVGEQWRQTTASANTLGFAYSTTANFVTSTSAFTAVSSLDFTALQNNGVGALDGNKAANRIVISDNVSISGGWADGGKLWIRWRDPNESGFDQGLGIDDLSFSTVVGQASVPEPAGTTLVLLTLGALTSSRRKRSRRPMA